VTRRRSSLVAGLQSSHKATKLRRDKIPRLLMGNGKLKGIYGMRNGEAGDSTELGCSGFLFFDIFFTVS
jgi:hypothetical protein